MKEDIDIKVLIFGKTYSMARLHLLSMVDNMEYGDIKKISKSMCNTYVQLTNGDTYQALSASDSARGYKYDKVYVNAEVDTEIINNIIRPMLCMSKLPVEEQIVIY